MDNEQKNRLDAENKFGAMVQADLNNYLEFDHDLFEGEDENTPLCVKCSLPNFDGGSDRLCDDCWHDEENLCFECGSPLKRHEDYTCDDCYEQQE